MSCRDQQEEEQFDENEAGLLSGRGGSNYGTVAGFNDPEDDEADRIYAEIDEKMGERRRSRRDKFEDDEERKKESLRPKTQLIFADLKRDLSRVSEAEWAAIPEVGDFRIKRLKRSGAIENPKERFLPVPDSVHTSLMNKTSGTIQETEEEQGEDGSSDFTKIGEARGKLLRMHLDQVSKSNTVEGGHSDLYAVEGQIDYPEQTEQTAIASDEKLAEIGDLKRARQLFASIIKTNKKNASGWISAARLEVQAGNMKQARALILRGTEECPKSEEIWREAVKLNEGDRETLARALRSVPESISLWLLAAEKETETTVKRKIIRSALERNASSSRLWMALVELEESEEDARLLLTRAVECASEAVELWVALARLQESTTQARQVLNRARQACPKSFTIWINAARLEESNDTDAGEIRKLLTRGATELSAQGIELSLKDWRREAEECERGGDVICAAELTKIGVELAQSIEDSQMIKEVLGYCRQSHLLVCARSALEAILEKNPNCKEAAMLLIEKLKCDDVLDYGALKRVYEASLGMESVHLWISYARDFRSESRDILTRAARSLPNESDQVQIWREAIKLEMPNFRSDPGLLEEFYANLPKDRSSELMIEVMRAYRVLGMQSRASDIARQCVEVYPKVAEFWIHLSVEEGDNQRSISILKRGLEHDVMSVKLVLKLAEIDEDFNSVQVALEKTRMAIQKSKIVVDGYDQVLLALCLLHCPSSLPNPLFPSKLTPFPAIRSRNPNALNLQTVKLLLNQSLKEMPRSAGLWCLAVWMEPRQLRRSKVTEALKRITSSTSSNTVGTSSNTQDEALLRWTLAVLLESPAKEVDLEKASNLDPFNFDLQAFMHHEHLDIDGNADWRQTNGVNWLRFIEQNGLYFEPVKDSYEKYLEFINGI